ncbi:MAG: glycosyltransferase family 4 protein [Limisphaerales bacterium]
MTSVHNCEDNRILHKECVSLAQSGYEVVFIAAGGTERSVEGVRIKSVKRANNRLVRMTLTSYLVFRMAVAERAEIHHLHDPELLPWGQFLRLMGSQVIFDMHENLPGAILTKRWLPVNCRRVLSFLVGVLERVLLQRLPVIFAEVSYQRLYPWVRNAVTVLNYPNVNRLENVSRGKCEEFTAGYMGSVEAIRGSVVTIDALQMFSSLGRQCRLQCVGSLTNAHRVELESRLSDDDKHLITFHGWKSPDAGWAIMAQCHVGLAILQEAPNYVESYPTKLFEYMALGLPVVASNFRLYREIVERHECGLCVDPSNPVAVAEALLYLAQNPTVAAAMGQRGRNAVRDHFSWSQQAEKLIAFYRDITRH